MNLNGCNGTKSVYPSESLRDKDTIFDSFSFSACKEYSYTTSGLFNTKYACACL